MKKLLFTMICLYNVSIFSQQFTTNTTPVGMEHNVLFDATNRYTVTQTGDATVNLRALFDGRFIPSYSGSPASTVSPTTILIENLPNFHTQTGAWVGWSTRFWQPKRFKIEGYNAYNGANEWVTIADYTNTDYTGGAKFISGKVPKGSYTKLRYTIYSTHGSGGKLGLSELFYIHPEATTPYKGLLASENDILWKKQGSNTYFDTGSVGIGTTDTKGFKLGVDGKIAATEVKVATYTNWPDYVFSKEYQLPTLQEVAQHIQEKGHLQNIPSAKEVKDNGGIELGEMNRKLLEKIEELTLYTIQQQKEIEELKKENRLLKKFEERINKLENKN
ncbi:conserved hypothetical protein [Tenacibaculum sediminilitoris]|uniref:hypothetical protein n=1 Tax=Tenacibaculum sediminilitoris TaxID=1820334 RepID=UPI003894332B